MTNKAREGERCDKCGGTGYTWVNNGMDDAERRLCERCKGIGQLWSSEHARDKATGRL